MEKSTFILIYKDAERFVYKKNTYVNITWETTFNIGFQFLYGTSKPAFPVKL